MKYAFNPQPFHVKVTGLLPNNKDISIGTGGGITQISTDSGVELYCVEGGYGPESWF